MGTYFRNLHKLLSLSFLVMSAHMSVVSAQPTINLLWLQEEIACDAQNIVSICYSFSNPLGDSVRSSVDISLSTDDGTTWVLQYDDWFRTLSDTAGDIGANVLPGLHCFQWLLSHDLPGIEDPSFWARLSLSGAIVELEDTNLILNGSFEQGIAHWSCYGSCDIDDTPHFGDSSFYIHTTSFGNYVYQSWPLVDNISYFFEFYARFESDSLKCIVVEVIRDWIPATGYGLPATVVSFSKRIDSLKFSIWGGADTVVPVALPHDVWHRISVFADVPEQKQTLYLNDVPLATVHADTSYTAQFLIAGAVSGSAANYGYIYFDDFLLTYLESNPYLVIDTTIAPIDSRNPSVSIACPETIIAGRDHNFVWSIGDLFFDDDPCSVRISGCGISTFFLVDGMSYNWHVPSLDCPSCTIFVAARDSFCNWGRDRCVFRIIRPSEIVVVLVCPPQGVFVACSDQKILFSVEIDPFCGIDSANTWLLIDSVDYFSLDSPELSLDSILRFQPLPGYWENGPHWFQLHIEDGCGNIFDSLFGL